MTFKNKMKSIEWYVGGLNLESAPHSLEIKVQGSGFMVQGCGFRVEGSLFRVQGSGFRVDDSGLTVEVLTFVYYTPVSVPRDDNVPSLFYLV